MLVETSSEVTDSNMVMTAKEVHSINNNNSDINVQVLDLPAHGTVEDGKLKTELLLLYLRRLRK